MKTLAESFADEREATNGQRGSPYKKYGRGLRIQAILFTLGAAAINGSMLPYHFAEYIPFGLFFSCVVLLQAIFVFRAITRPSRRLFQYAFWGTAIVLLWWGVALTTGLPVGPFAGRTEPVWITDILAIVFEGFALLLLAFLAWRIRWNKESRVWKTTLGTVPIFLLVGIFTFLGVETGLNGEPFAINMGMNMNANASASGMVDMRNLVQPPGDQPVKAFTLTAEVTTIGGHTVWTYNNLLPGPELRVTQGDRLKVTLINHLPESTTIHWHGIRLPNAEDGVAGVTQDAVPPGGTFTYDFVVPDAGTYWYHSHQDTESQVPHGLYGALIVLPKTETSQTYAHDYAVTIGDVSSQDKDNEIVVNGTPGDYHLNAQPGDLVRLRIINAEQADMTGSPETVALVGAPYQVVALDGNDLNQPQEIGPELLSLGVGQRADLVFRMPASGQVKLFDERLPLGSHVPRNETVSIGTGAVPARPDRTSLNTFDLTTYGVAAADPLTSRTSFDVNQDLHIQNGHGFRDGGWENVHMINGKSSPYTDPIVVYPGQVVHLRFINETDEYHPMHLHGHTFTILSKNGKPLTGSPVKLDSILVGPNETWDVAFVANNPGLWMLHCHVLLHAQFGLSTMIVYANVMTPYVIGTKSGNFPE